MARSIASIQCIPEVHRMTAISEIAAAWEVISFASVRYEDNDLLFCANANLPEQRSRRDSRESEQERESGEQNSDVVHV